MDLLLLVGQAALALALGYMIGALIAFIVYWRPR